MESVNGLNIIMIIGILIEAAILYMVWGKLTIIQHRMRTRRVELDGKLNVLLDQINDVSSTITDLKISTETTTRLQSRLMEAINYLVSLQEDKGIEAYKKSIADKNFLSVKKDEDSAFEESDLAEDVAEFIPEPPESPEEIEKRIQDHMKDVRDSMEATAIKTSKPSLKLKV